MKEAVFQELGETCEAVMNGTGWDGGARVSRTYSC